LFTEHPRKLEEAHIMSIGEDPTHREVDALTPHSKPRARPGRWDKGPPLAATDAQGKSGDIRPPPAVGEGQQPDALATLLASSSALELAEEERLKRVRSGFRERRALRTCYAFKSRSPKEISELLFFAMDHPDLDVAVPQDLARCAADLAEMRRTKGSEWQKCRAKLYGYIGENARDILADFDEQYKRSPEDELSWGHTYITQPHASHTYMQDARRAVEEPVHPPNGGTELIASQDDRGGGTEHEALATEASGPEGCNDRASADSEEELPAPLASDEEEDNDRSEQRLGSSYTHTHTLTHTPIPPKNNICPPSLTPFPRIIASTADATTKGEAGCRPAASEPSSLSGGESALKNLIKLDAARGESALASTSGKSASKHPAETSKKEDGPQELGRSLDTQAGEGADYGASHSTQQVTFEGAKALAQAQGKTSRAYRRQQRRNRVATEAARDAAGEAPWAVLVGEERGDGQQQEPTQECDDWGLYCQATDGDGYHPSCNLR
jgi:hypothetical protein